MKTYILMALVWLGCTLAAPVSATPAWMSAAEHLNYTVSWGVMTLGKATLSYTPEDTNGYTLGARVKDSSMLIDLEDEWKAHGRMANGIFQPSVYTAKQKENDYRADKRVTFTDGTAVYENLISSEPKVTVTLPEGAKDALSTLYTLRAMGPEALRKGHNLPVMGLKQVNMLAVRPAVAAEQQGGMTTLWRVDMFLTHKGRTERWRLWLRNNENLTPVKIEAKLKLGTFTATLKQ